MLKRFKRLIIQLLVDTSRFVQYGDLPTWYYIRKGLVVGNCFNRQSGTRLDISNCWLIKIGNNVTLANRVQFLAHDDSSEQWSGYRRIGKIIIEDNVFLGAGVLVMPGVTIGKNSIVASGAVVTKSIPPNSVVAGVPAKLMFTLDQYLNKIDLDIEKAYKQGRVLSLTYDIFCRSRNKFANSIEPEKRYYFKITRFCDKK